MIYRFVDASLLNLTGLEDLLGFANKSTDEYPHRQKANKQNENS
jgi:hypothetical protein